MKRVHRSIGMRGCLTGGAVLLVIAASGTAFAQFSFSSGSDGSDGVFNPLVDLVVDMTDHPDGIYQYSSVDIPADITVTFLSNALNTPVTWLVQDQCVIDGTVRLDGVRATGNQAGNGGPGGFRGGNGSSPNLTEDPGPGFGPGGAIITSGANLHGGGAGHQSGGATDVRAHPPGGTYGNSLLLPLIGGSGGSGAGRAQSGGGGGGGGGGGAILIAATNGITVTGSITATGGQGFQISAHTSNPNDTGGSGSGGAIRLVAPVISGTGSISAIGGAKGPSGGGSDSSGAAGGRGRVRLEGDLRTFSGSLSGSQSTSSAPGILILPTEVLPLLTISSVGGEAAPGTPSGDLLNPDIVFDVAATNPMAIVVDGQNLDPDTLVTVEARPEHGPIVTASGALAGTVEASSVTISMDLPAGAGVIFAHAVNGVMAKTVTASTSFSETGLAPNGERFAKVEVVAALGGAPQAVYVTPSGRRFLAPVGK